MEITALHWAIIINPKSGKKKYKKQSQELFQTLDDLKISYHHRITEFAAHATYIARSLTEQGFKNFLVLGGDGTISEVINGIFSANVATTQDIKIALIPRGTGNDWGRFWGITRNFKRSLHIFLRGKTQAIDVGKVSFSIESEKCTHYFINSVGFGLDAHVVRLTHRLKEVFGSHSFLYSVAMLLAVFTYKSHKGHITSVGHAFEGKLLTMNIANGCYSGGGMKQNPDAIPTDGEFDVMLAKQPRFVDIIGALTYLVRGKLTEHPVIMAYRTKSITVDLEENARAEADGIVVNGISPYEVNVLPAAIQMVV